MVPAIMKTFRAALFSLALTVPVLAWAQSIEKPDGANVGLTNATSAALQSLVNVSVPLTGALSWAYQSTPVLQFDGTSVMRFPIDNNSQYMTLLGSRAGQGATVAANSTVAVGVRSCGGFVGITGVDNTCLGALAGSNFGDATLSTAVGTNALSVSQHEISGTAVGRNSMKLTTGGGTGATALGSGTMANPTGAMSHNSALGYLVLQGQTSSSGQFNTGLGSLAGSSVLWTTGAHNTFGGYSSFLAVTTGSNNSIWGDSAGNKITTGSRNSILGNAVASTTLATGSDNVLIGTTANIDTAGAGTSNTIQIGAGSTCILCVTGGGTPTTAISTLMGVHIFPNMPTADPHVVGGIWSNLGILTRSAG